MADIFISYAREDRDWVEKLATALQGEGFTVWWDWDLLVGKRYREAIETELGVAKATVVVWSQSSVHSDFVRDEAEEGQQRNILVPVLKEAVRPPAGFRQLQTADLASWNGAPDHAEFRRMLKGVSHLVGRPAKDGTGDAPADAAAAVAGQASPVAQTPTSAPAPAAIAAAAKPATPAAAPSAIPSAFAGLSSGKIPSASHPVWRYVAIGLVGGLAVIFLVSQLMQPSSKPTPPIGGNVPIVHSNSASGGQNTGSGTPGSGPNANSDGTPNANGDIAGNPPHGATSNGSGSGNATSGGDASQGTAQTGGTTTGDTGSDVGQTGPHH
jgi:TIR domain